MSPSEALALVVPRDERWTVADEFASAFFTRYRSANGRLRLERERVRNRLADKRLTAERRYDAETERLRRLMADADGSQS